MFFVRLMLVCLVLTVGAVADADPPNVVLIIGDDQSWGDFGFMGHPAIKTPHLDALAAESLVFRRGYVVSSLCRPSLATIATGLYPHEHGITGNDPSVRRLRESYLKGNEEWIGQFEQSPTIAGMLGREGYVSHQSGKWWEGNYKRGGFTEGMTHGDPKRGGRHGDDGLKIGRDTMAPVFDFIDDAGENPFFIWYAPFLPHLPHNPPERLVTKYRVGDRPEEIAMYFAMCEWFDETVGQLVGHLEEKGLRENTIILFISDNGWIQPLKGDPEFRSPYGGPRGKRSPYDGGLRTPIIVNWPGHVAPGVSDVPVSSIDIAPTIAAAAGVERNARWSGINLLDSEAVRTRKAIFGVLFSHDAVDITNPVSSLQYRWVVQGRWKLIDPYIKHLPDARRELYDLESDPEERIEKSKENPEVVKILVDALDGWWDEAAKAL